MLVFTQLPPLRGSFYSLLVTTAASPQPAAALMSQSAAFLALLSELVAALFAFSAVAYANSPALEDDDAAHAF